ncbi:MAG: hypothetical protein AAGH46_03545 [Bacteroidota bacterium]
MPSAERFQSFGTILALVISIAAMFISVYEANILKSQQTSMVWPYLHMSQQYDNEGFGVLISNKGTGPAIVTSVQVDYNGLPIERMDILMDSLNPNRRFGYDILTNNTINNQVFMSGEQKLLFRLPYRDDTRIVLDNMYKVRMRVAYKSVLDEHWLYDSEEGTHTKTKFKATTEFKN